MDKIYDVTIVGAGTGGMRVARRCASRGAQVALIDKASIGGRFLIRDAFLRKR
ncbi:MAG: FAD-dependent oxidoreductase [Phycisphaeraceae bacterium]|nr:FAD-dependent oxidoreductase [Phycisphaeraceae bacterium]